MSTQELIKNLTNLETGINFILKLRHDLNKENVCLEILILVDGSCYTLDHWLGVCKRCAIVGDPMPWEG